MLQRGKAVGGLGLVLLLTAVLPVARAADRPNFVFLYTDDQRFDALSVVQQEQGGRGRFPWFRTPNMDRIAAEGVRFRNAFVVNSLCSPSRACFLTGRYSHLNGVANNHTPYPVDNVTWATELRKAGYTTGYVGKYHMGGQAGQRAGFDYSASFVGQGRYVDCPFEINGAKTETQGWVDDVSTDFAIGFLRKHHDKPFALALGFKSPHGPFDPPPRLAKAFDGALANRAVNAGAFPPYRTGTPAGEPKPEQVPINLGYFRTIAAVDENVGRLLQTLDELKLADNTMVVFSSDNGFYLGEHGLGDKRSAYDESLRIPLLVRYPKLGVKGKTVDAMALNIDLPSTLLDFAEVAVPEGMQGRSWRPLLEGKPADWRKAFFYEYFYENNFAIPTVLAVRTDDAKLIRYPGHPEWTELFDLKADPHEMKNLFADPARADLRQRLEAEYDRQAKAVDFKIPPYADDPTKAPPKRKVLDRFVLEFRFEKDENGRVADTSGSDNHGVAHNLPAAKVEDGRRSRRFDGKSYIDVRKAPTLDCSEGPWTVQALVKADKADGMILARGGASLGYALLLEEGKPVFVVRARDGGLVRAAGKEAVAGRWTHLTGVIGANREARLYVDGKLAAKARLPRFFPRDPSDTMQIGADTGSPVLGEDGPKRFVGLIGLVKVFNGERPAAAIQTDADQALPGP